MRWNVASWVSTIRLAAREATDCVGQDIQLSETRHNLIYEGLGALASRYLCWERGEVWTIEIRLLNFSRCASNRCTSVEEGPRHIRSQSTVRPGHEYNLAVHLMLRSHEHQIPTSVKGYGRQ